MVLYKRISLESFFKYRIKFFSVFLESSGHKCALLYIRKCRKEFTKVFLVSIFLPAFPTFKTKGYSLCRGASTRSCLYSNRLFCLFAADNTSHYIYFFLIY